MNADRHHTILTGATGGLGRATALALASRCEYMLLAGGDAEKLRDIKRELQARHPPVYIAVVEGDLTKESTQSRIANAASSFATPPDLLINNAGINDFHDFESQAPETVERLLAVDLIAPIQLTRVLLPQLKSAPRAQIINVGSIYGYLGYPGFAVYSAAKFGLRGFSQALRRELSDTHVAVRYFAPRAIRTPLTTPAISAMNHVLSTTEDGADEVARKLIAFLDTDAWELKIGFPERLYVFLNQVLPGIVDNSIRGQLATIRKHLPAGRPV